MKVKKKKTIFFLIFYLVLLILVFIRSVNLNPLYFEGAFFWGIVITGSCLIWIISTFWDFISVRISSEHHVNFVHLFTGLKIPKPVFIVAVLPWVYMVVMIVVTTPLISWNAYRNQLGETETRTFSSDIQVMDMSKLPIVDAELALKLADKKLGEKPSLGSQVMLGEPTLQMVGDNLTWAVPLQHSGFFKWFTNMSGTPGYIAVSATNVNDVKYVDSYKIKYQPNCYLFDDLLRHTRFSGGLFDGITDYSFELNDEGKPYWAVTTYSNKAGFGLPEATGVLLVDAATGSVERYTVDTVPEWVDRVQPEQFIIQQINNRGEYVRGIFNFANKDKYKASRGQAIIYNDGNCYLMTCVTSVGSDESSIGFMLVDMVSKKSFLYEMAGATEYSAQRSAEGKVQHLGYRASSPIIINISSQPTYFMTLKDKEGLIKQYAFVSVVNYSTVGTGETIGAALNDYQKALSNDSSLNLGEIVEMEELTGTVNRIASEFNGTNCVYKMILNEKPGKIFVLESTSSDELALTQSGDKVTVSFLDMEQQSIRAAKFDNLNIR